MSKKDFQNGFALGLASGGVVEIEKEEQEKSIDITENGTTEVTPDEGKTLSGVTVNVEVASGGGGDPYEVINSIINGTITEFYTEESFAAAVQNASQNFGYLFNICTNLTKWAMPNNVNNLGTYCFRYCNALTYIDIGKPPKCEPSLFYGKHLKGVSVVIRAETPPTLSGVFTATSFDNTTVFYVPKNSIDAYKSATNWSTYADCFKAIEDYPEITGGVI